MSELSREAIRNLVRDVRRRVNESTATFGARFYVEGRTLEGWEQGIRTPNRLVVDALLKLHKDLQ